MLLVIFLLAALYLSRRYHAPFLEAASALSRAIVLTLIKTCVTVYDPYISHVAELGPNSHGAVNPTHLIQAERVVPFARGIPVDYDPQDRIRILKTENPLIVRSRFPFRYQPYDEPRLQELRSKYHLDEVIKRATSEFEGFVLLRDWARSQFRRKDYQPHTHNFDALEILDRHLTNAMDEPFDPEKHIDPCHFFPLLYCQVVLAMGYTARLVSIGHGMAEVWSNQFKKWVTMDAELDLHYEKDGVPLNMLEVHEENFAPRPSRIRIVQGHPSFGDSSTPRVRLGVKEVSVESMIKSHLNTNVIVEMRNDWLTNHYFVGHPMRSEYNTLVYEDPRVPVSVNVRDFLRPQTSRKEDFYWSLNQTEIWVRTPSPAGCLGLVFKTVTPNFDHFEIQVDKQEPRHSVLDTFEWPLHEGDNSLSVVSVNKFGIRGIPSTIRLLKEIRVSADRTRTVGAPSSSAGSAAPF